MFSTAQAARRIVVNSRPSPRWRRPPSSQTPTACLVKPVAARRDFVGPMWDPPIRNLQLQPGLFLSASRALVWEDQFIHPKVLESFRAIQAPDLADSIQGLCQKCASRESRIA